MKLIALPLFIFLFLILSSVNVLGVTLNISTSSDAFVSEYYPSTNYGYDTHVHIGNGNNTTFTYGDEFGYFMFDLSSIPSTATITNATLNLRQQGASVGTFDFLIYNTSLNWNETNLTWDAKPSNSFLQKNFSRTTGSGTVYWTDYEVTNSIQSGLATNKTSLMIRYNLANQSTYSSVSFYNRSLNPAWISVNFVVNSSGVLCNTTHLGSYCDPLEISTLGYSTHIITSPDYTCNNDLVYECPSGSICGQITPQVSIVSPLIENFVDCSACWYAKYQDINHVWFTFWTNCPNNAECDNCNGLFCQAHTFVTNLTTVPTSVEYYTAGCFNSNISTVIDVIDENGTQTTVNNLTLEVFPDATYTYNGTCYNTTSTCFDASCNEISCPNAPSTYNACNAGFGTLALMIGNLVFGTVDCVNSLYMFSIIASVFVGFIGLFFVREAYVFILGSMSMLVGFTLLAWFPSWVMIILIVISAYITAKGLGG